MRSRSFALVVFTLAMLASSADAKNMFIPVVALANGENNTTFRTDVRIFNPSPTEAISVTLQLVPAGTDGRNFSGTLVIVGPREMKVINNVVRYLWSTDGPFVGTLRLDSDADRSYEFTADSRTYTDSPQGAAFGTFGQFIPALDPAAARTRSAVLHLSNSTDRSEGFRTNAGVMNPGLEEATVTPTLYHASGQLAKAGAPFAVPPRGVVQTSLAAMFDAPSSSITEGYLVYESTHPVFGYASVVDNRSGDQIFVLGTAETE